MDSEKLTLLIKEAVNYLMEADLKEENGWQSEDIEMLEKLQDENFSVNFDGDLKKKFDLNTLREVDNIIKDKLEEIDKKIKATDDDNKQKYLVMEEYAVKCVRKEVAKLQEK